MTSDSSSLRVVNLQSQLGADLGFFDVEETAQVSKARFCISMNDLLHIVRKHVPAGPEKHGVGDLSVKPLGLIEGQPSDLGADHTKQGPAHGQEN